MLHTKKGRESRDLDFAVAIPLSNQFLEDRGYFVHKEKGKDVRRTPRGFKIDIYSRDLNGIPVETIAKTAVEILVNRKKNWTVKASSLEVLLISKHRAGRNQDTYDLKLLAQERFNDINWKTLKSLTRDETEFQAIKTALEFQHDS
jgi:hypothetical protein